MILELIRKWRARSVYLKRLQAFRKVNPTCYIQNVNFHDLSIGECCALLEGTYLKSVSMGRYSYISYGASIINTKIGSFCSVGPKVQIGLNPHPSRDYVSTYPAFYSSENIVCPQAFTNISRFDDSVPATFIGNDVWIGIGAIIPGGISVGNGAIIAAGAVVTKNVPPYAIVGGNPSRLIRMRFDDADIHHLLQTQWWDWPLDKIISYLDKFMDVKRFRDIY